MVKIAVSLLSCDLKKIGEEIYQLEQDGADYAHIDVMDGIFVPNITFGMPVIAACRPVSKIFFDVHLMIEEPIKYIDEFAKAGADLITIHLEACRDVEKTIEQIRKNQVQVGLAINPETELKKIYPFISLVDMILIMTVHPGFGGQKLIPECLDKVRRLKAYMKEHHIEIPVEIDGGVNNSTIKEAKSSGADIIVSGSSVYNSPNHKEAISYLRSI